MPKKCLCQMNHRDLLGLFRSSHRRCSVKEGALQKFAKFHRKTTVSASLFDKVAGPGLQLYEKETSRLVFS